MNVLFSPEYINLADKRNYHQWLQINDLNTLKHWLKKNLVSVLSIPVEFAKEFQELLDKKVCVTPDKLVLHMFK